jgi:LmbE family N-acetylglucosaminyl deacetylase
MADRPLTLMAVHAHPDDEATSTGGVLARYAAEGATTVLVTCTNGELGDAPEGMKPGDAGHDTERIVELRMQELKESCAVLGVTHLELLGYHDSGMEGWPQNDAPEAFWQADVAEAGGRLAALMERYRPQVVVTYDAHGFYGHPDHIQANRVTHAAIEQCKIPDKLYYTAVPRSLIATFATRLAELGIELPGPIQEDPEFGTPDELVTTFVDCAQYGAKKYASLAKHASQSENIFFLKMGEENFTALMGNESFSRVLDTTGAPVPEDDLFAGLR